MTPLIQQEDKDYYLNVAKTVAERSTCFLYKEGAVLVSKDDKILSTGYNGAVHRCIDCRKNGICTYEVETGNISDCSQEQCMGLHAEIRAILDAPRDALKDSVLYVYSEDRQTNKPIKVQLNGVIGHIIQECNIKEVIVERGVIT